MARKWLFAALVLVCLSLAATPAAGAQSYDYDRQVSSPPAPTSPTNSTGAEQRNQSYEAYIDGKTRIVSAEYDAEAGTATLVIESDRPQAVTLADGGALADGQSGEIAETTRVVESGERQSITVPVTQAGGLVAVTVSTQDTLYGYIFSPPSESVFEKTTARDGWLGGSTAAIAMFGLAAYRVKNNTKDTPEEIE